MCTIYARWPVVAREASVYLVGREAAIIDRGVSILNSSPCVYLIRMDDMIL